LAAAFAASLDLADAIILLPIYPARELPMEGVSSQLILDKMKNENKRMMGKEELMQYLQKEYLPGIHPEFAEVLITAGAGDIDNLVQPIKALINH
jgi:UDP-N-acetylmuramate--alanine ligase